MVPCCWKVYTLSPKCILVGARIVVIIAAMNIRVVFTALCNEGKGALTGPRKRDLHNASVYGELSSADCLDTLGNIFDTHRNHDIVLCVKILLHGEYILVREKCFPMLRAVMRLFMRRQRHFTL